MLIHPVLERHTGEAERAQTAPRSASPVCRHDTTHGRVSTAMASNLRAAKPFLPGACTMKRKASSPNDATAAPGANLYCPPPAASALDVHNTNGN